METLVIQASRFFSNPVILFFAGILGTKWALAYLKKLVDGVEKVGHTAMLLGGLANGIVLFIVGYFAPNATPFLVLLGCPLMVLLDLYYISKDRFYTYLYLFIKLVMNFICIYWLVVSLAGVFPAANVPIGTLEYKITIIIFTLLFLSGWSFYLSRSKIYPFKELYNMIHQKKVGWLFFLYLSICDIFLIISTVVLTPLLEKPILDRKLAVMIYSEIFIKNFLIFSISYLILFIQAYEERQRKIHEEMKAMLEKERSFRNNVQKKGLLHFFINVSRNKLEEGHEFFGPEAFKAAKSYQMMVDKFCTQCIHPSYHEEFKDKNRIEFFAEQLKNSSHFNHQIRVSPQRLAEFFHFSKETADRLSSMEEAWIWIKIDYILTRDEHTGDIYAYVAVFDVDSKVRQKEELMISATMDSLTGVYNRATLENAVRQRLLNEGGSGAFILLDIDSFKKVNDVLGHPKGDEVLKEISDVLRGVFREEDILGRLGGDEFCIFISGMTSNAVIEARASEINQRCRKVYYADTGEEIRISVSIGIAVCTEQYHDYEVLYKQADLALYQTKSKGKDGYSIYKEE